MVIAEAVNPGKRNVGLEVLVNAVRLKFATPVTASTRATSMTGSDLQGCARWAGEMNQKIAQPYRLKRRTP